jgi:hypothetical protein
MTRSDLQGRVEDPLDARQDPLAPLRVVHRDGRALFDHMILWSNDEMWSNGQTRAVNSSWMGGDEGMTWTSDDSDQ